MFEGATAFVSLLFVALHCALTQPALALRAAAGIVFLLGLVSIFAPYRRRSCSYSGWALCSPGQLRGVTVIACVLGVTAPARAGGGSLTAQYIGVQTVVDGALSAPQGAAVDGSGNVYIADTGASQVVIETLSGGTYTRSTVGSGLSSPAGVAVDASGNVYIIDTGNDRLLKEALSGGTYTQSTIASGFDAPDSVAVDASGNVYVADTANGDVVKETPSGGSYTQTRVTNSTSGNPLGVAVDNSGNVYITDRAGNLYMATLSGGSYTLSTLVSGSFSNPLGLAVDGSGNVYVADSGSFRVSIETPSGGLYVQTSIFGGLSSPSGVAVDASGNIYIGDTGNNRAIKVQTANFGSLNLRSTSSKVSLMFVFMGSSGTIGVPAVLTQGAPGLDFADAGTGTCDTNGTSHVYFSGDTCTIDVTFTPQFPGIRYGAAVLVGNSGSVMATGFASGVGLGALATFAPGTTSTIGSGLVIPFGIAVDATGNVFVADQIGTLYKESLFGGVYTQSTLATGLASDSGVAVDGAGNLYVDSVSTGDVVKFTLANGAYAQSTVVSALGNLNGVAVDTVGNLFMVSYRNNVCYKETRLANDSYVQTQIGNSFSGPTGVAVDLDGNVYVSNDISGNIYKETPQANGNYVQTTLLTGFVAPEAVAVDDNGNLYIADTGARTQGGFVSGVAYKEELQGNGSYVQSIIASGLTTLWWIAVDQKGNPYLSQRNPGIETLITLGAQPGLTFASATVGSISSDSPQIVTVSNIGNAALLFPIPSSGDNPSISTNFTLNSSAVTACPLVVSGGATGSLAANTACALAISFAPIQAGSISGSLVLTDTTLNAPGPGYATQTVSLNGTAVAANTVTTLVAAPSSASVGQPVTSTATVSPTPTGSPLGAVGFYDGETLLGSANVNSSGAATFSTAALSLGAHSLTAVYSGNTSFEGSTSTAFIETITAVTTAATTTTLAATPNPASAGQSVTFTGTVSPAPSGASLGAISFYNGSTLLATVNLNSSGGATFSISGLPTGELSITADYSGNAGSAASTSAALAETINTAYTVTGPSAPVVVSEGGDVKIDINVPPLGGAFNSLVTMSASGLPPSATASFTPPTVTPGVAGAPTVLNIQLAALSASSFDTKRKSPYRHLPLMSFALAISLCGAGFRGKRLLPKGRRALAFAVLFGVTLASIGCSGGFLAPPVTQPGSYVVTITGTSGALQASTTVTVVVR